MDETYPAAAYAAQKMAYAQGQLSQGYAGGADTARAPGLLTESAQRMSQLGSLLEQTLEELTSVNTRLFGPRPQPPGGALGKNGISGQAGDMLSALEILVDRAQAVREEARGINARI